MLNLTSKKTVYLIHKITNIALMRDSNVHTHSLYTCVQVIEVTVCITIVLYLYLIM